MVQGLFESWPLPDTQAQALLTRALDPAHKLEPFAHDPQPTVGGLVRLALFVLIAR